MLLGGFPATAQDLGLPSRAGTGGAAPTGASAVNTGVRTGALIVMWWPGLP